MRQLDSLITSKSDFKKIIISNIRKMFTFSEELYNAGAGCVYVDMNSVMAILFRHDKINDKELISDITNIFEEFIDHCVRSSTKVKFLYTSKKAKVHSTIYPDWCKDRYERVNIKNSNFILNFLTAIKTFNETNKLIEIGNIEDKHIAQYIYEDYKMFNRVCYIVTKDFVCQNLIFKINCIICTGVAYIDYRDKYPLMFNGVDVTELLPKGLEWVYPIIAGDVRNEYKGVHKYSIKSTVKYLNNNKIKILIESPHPLKEHIDKYRPLYDVDYMIEYYNNM